MNSINIKDLELNISLPIILNAISANSYVEIDINGDIYINEKSHASLPIVFKCENFDKNSSIMDATTIAKTLFKEYKPVVNGGICTIKPLVAWQNVIDLNKDRMLYFDHHSDGVEIFEDKKLEDIGWEATALDINYREITEFIEEHCDGFLTFYDNGIQFNGFVIVNDIENTRLKVSDYIVKKADEKIKDGDLDCEDEDVINALNFFKVQN